MPTVGLGNVINSLNSFQDEFIQPFPNYRVRRYLAYAKIPSVAGTTVIPLMVPSRQKGVEDKQLQFRGGLGLSQEQVYSIRPILTVPCVVGATDKLKVADAIGNVNAWVSGSATAGKLDASVHNPSTVALGTTSGAVGITSRIGTGLLNLYVTDSTGVAASTTGIRIDTAPATQLQKDILAAYKDQPYFLFAVNTWEQHVLSAPTTIEEANARFAPAIQEVFKGM